ncbi:XrtA system polysaccharide chain length determinant [Arhodomonas aquaeolei]|uniref:XrtA system polysaccharide chain length determinant n=1 Tax=Arhodomonas aquaeolei TaxID=2369 RepID=UPI000381461D|nr:XrtA system polysaccharide chain length determinant [Arhodomonas aquaeolei]
MNGPIDQILRLVLAEGVRRKWAVLAVFLSLLVVGTLVTFVWPRSFTSSVTLFVEEQSIIDPLMEGRAVRPDLTSQAQNAREVIYGRTLLTRVLTDAGEVGDDTPPLAVEQAAERLRDRIEVTTPGENLIRIAYSDHDAEHAFQVTKLIAEAFRQEMLANQRAESNAAFRFIDAQVRRYEGQLRTTQEQIDALRKRYPVVEVNAAEQVGARMGELRRTIDTLEQSLREAMVREASLQRQLSGEVQVSAVLSRADQYRARIAELEGRLEQLRLNYHDTYPDIVQLRDQISALRAKAQEAAAESEGQQGPSVSLRGNPVYQELQQSLYEVRTEAATIRARLADVRQRYADATGQAEEVQALQGQMDQLTRDYAVNQDIYQDLLRRRENARVSMNLDNQGEGLTLRVHEPAFLPQRPDGPRTRHFTVATVLVGASVPVGLLLVLVGMSPRVHMPEQLPELYRMAVVGRLPRYRTAAERRRGFLSLSIAGLLAVLGVIALLAVMLVHAEGGL